MDGGLVALESISSGKDIYYGTLRCCMLTSKDNYPRQRPAPWFLRHILLLPVQCRTILPTKGRDRTSCYRFEYDLHLIKIPSHLDHESIYSVIQSHSSIQSHNKLHIQVTISRENSNREIFSANVGAIKLSKLYFSRVCALTSFG